MSTTVNIVCYTSKKLSNGESPLMVRVCKDRKNKYKSLGISVNPVYWDFDKTLNPQLNFVKIEQSAVNKISTTLFCLKNFT